MSSDFRDVEITKLSALHNTVSFDCGSEALNRYLDRYALVNTKAGAAQTYVAAGADGVVLGYYSLTVGSVEHAAAPARVTKGLARHPVPVMLLARLAISTVFLAVAILLPCNFSLSEPVFCLRPIKVLFFQVT